MKPLLLSLIPIIALTPLLSGTALAAPKIVGGTVAGATEFGFAAALLTHGVTNAFDAQSCGGALIHAYWVATAAHCVEGIFADELDVLVGTADLNNTAGAQRIRVAEIFRHPGFVDNGDALDNDVALLLLESPATADRPVLPLIDDTTLALPGTNATLIGWGNTTATGNPSTVLRKAVVPILDSETVNQPSWLNNQVTATMLAAGNAAGGTDSCQGDSGGPLLVRGPGGLGWRLAGIVSWGDGCAEPRHPGVNARISRFRQWMHSYVWPDFAAWEQGFAIGTEAPPDADRDGLAQWIEYAMKTSPLSGDGTGLPIAGRTAIGGVPYATLSFRRRAAPRDVSLGVRESPNLTTWTAVDSVGNRIGAPTAIAGELDMELVTVRGNQPAQPGTSGFLQLEATPSRAYTATVRALAINQAVLSRLNNFDPVAGTSYRKEFRLSGQTPGVSVPVKVESTVFRPVITVLNAATGASVATATAGTNGTGTLSFTPGAGISYHIAVTSFSASATGYFGLTAGIINLGLPLFAVPSAINGTLTTSDEVDPDFLPVFYRYDLYQLTGTTAGRACRVAMNSSVMDTQLYILDDGGAVIAEDDDGGTGSNAAVTFTPLPARTYQVFATTAVPDQTGAYTLSATLP